MIYRFGMIWTSHWNGVVENSQQPPRLDGNHHGNSWKIYLKYQSIEHHEHLHFLNVFFSHRNTVGRDLHAKTQPLIVETSPAASQRRAGGSLGDVSKSIKNWRGDI